MLYIMEQQIESAQSYYNTKRKKSFLFSRMFVFVSMFLLLIALGINIALLNTHQRTTTSTQAAGIAATTSLPVLPTGCIYESNTNKVTVRCDGPTVAPSLDKTPNENGKMYPIDIPLPALAEGCQYLTTNDGYIVACENQTITIPETMVTPPLGCKVTKTGETTLSCSKVNQKETKVPLPPLPQGCNYKTVASGNGSLSITCTGTQVRARK